MKTNLVDNGFAIKGFVACCNQAKSCQGFSYLSNIPEGMITCILYELFKIRIAKIYDSPDLPENEATFSITGAGVDDAKD